MRGPRGDDDDDEDDTIDGDMSALNGDACNYARPQAPPVSGRGGVLLVSSLASVSGQEAERDCRPRLGERKERPGERCPRQACVLTVHPEWARDDQRLGENAMASPP